MVIVSCIVELDLPDVFSLKDKRRIIKPIISRMPQKFRVAVAEVGRQNVWNSTVLGIVAIGNDERHLKGMMEKVILWIERERPDAPVGSYSIESIY